MTTADWLGTAESNFNTAGIDTPRLDALLLLSDVTGKDKSHILAHPALELNPNQLARLAKMIARRVNHEPLAYIRGKSEFYGREFAVNNQVLVPRPESETMIELLKFFSRTDLAKECTVIDVGTGSGALAITAKLELPGTNVFGVDTDPNCLKVAQENANKHAANVKFLQSDLLSNLPITSRQSPVAILANLPYVPDDYPINQAATHEPALALFGGTDGLDLYRTLFGQLPAITSYPITIITESLANQHQTVTEIATNQGFTPKTQKDLIQVFSKG